MVSLVEEAKTLRHQPFHPHNSALEDVVRLKRQAMWREENKTAIEASNLCGGTSCPDSDGLRL
jgi:antitoxin CcdA